MFALFLRDHSVGHVALIGDEHFLSADFAMGVDLSEPVESIVKTVFFCYIVDYENTVCVIVKSLGERSESLLAGGVVHLHLDLLLKERDHFVFLGYSNC